MPMALWWGKVNKRLFNPRAIENGKWQVINHIGRSSGRSYRTPLEAHEVDGTFVFILVYGSGSDWVRNILESGSAVLESGEGQVELGSPRLLSGREAWPLLKGIAKKPPGFLRVDEFLQMDIVSRHQAATTADRA